MGLSIVLIQPEIPGNTGAVGRTCVALGMELILIHPLGFEISDKRVKRSGLDYWPHVRLTEYATWDAFLEARAPRPDQLFLFEEFGARSFYEPDYPEDADDRLRVLREGELVVQGRMPWSSNGTFLVHACLPGVGDVLAPRLEATLEVA